MIKYCNQCNKFVSDLEADLRKFNEGLCDCGNVLVECTDKKELEIDSLRKRVVTLEAERDHLQRRDEIFRDAMLEVSKCPRCESCASMAAGIPKLLREARRV